MLPTTPKFHGGFRKVQSNPNIKPADWRLGTGLELGLGIEGLSMRDRTSQLMPLDVTVRTPKGSISRCGITVGTCYM